MTLHYLEITQPNLQREFQLAGTHRRNLPPPNLELRSVSIARGVALVVARLTWWPKAELATGYRRIAGRPSGWLARAGRRPESPRTVARGWWHDRTISAIAQPTPKTPCVTLAEQAQSAQLRVFHKRSDFIRFLVPFWSFDRFSREGVLETLHYLQRLAR